MEKEKLYGGIDTHKENFVGYIRLVAKLVSCYSHLNSDAESPIVALSALSSIKTLFYTDLISSVLICVNLCQ